MLQFTTSFKLRPYLQVLEILFSNGDRFRYPSEYLRVYSPAADSTKVDADGQRKVIQQAT